MESIVEAPRPNLERILNAQRELPEVQVSNRFRGLNVLGMVGDQAACGYYRVVLPLHLLKMHGATVEYSSMHSLDKFMKHDVIIAQRQHSPEVYEIIRFLGWEAKHLIYEIDDDLHSVLPTSPAYITYHQGSDELRWIDKFMQACDGITTTTIEIARWYSQNSVNAAVIPNFIDFGFRDWSSQVTYDIKGMPNITLEDIPKPESWEGKIVIGWSGGNTHQEDLEQIIQPIKTILNRYDNVMFVMYCSVQLYNDVVLKHNLPKEKVDFIEPRHFMDFPSGLKGIDIGLAPIVSCQFNLCKSDLKVKEYMAQGVVPVASNVGPYARFYRQHPGSFSLVGFGEDCSPTWYEAIVKLIENPEKLQEMKKAGRELIANKYSLEKNIELWPTTWKTIIERKSRGIVGKPQEKLNLKQLKSYGLRGPNEPCPCGSKKKYKTCCNGAFG